MVDDTTAAGPHQMRLRSRAVDWLDIEDQVVALDGERSVYLSTNASGKILWHSLAEGATVDSLVDQLVATYGIEQQRAQSDVADFIEMLKANDLLEAL